MLVFSVMPALQAMRAQVSDTLRQSGRTLTPGRRRQWLRSTLATTQVALALALLFGSTLAMTAADRTVNGVLGFDKHNVLVGTAQPARARHTPIAEKRRRFIDERDGRACARFRPRPAIGVDEQHSRRLQQQRPAASFPRARNWSRAEARFVDTAIAIQRVFQPR